MGCSLFLCYYCISHCVVSAYLNSQCTLQRHRCNEGHVSPQPGKEQDPLPSLQTTSLRTLGHVLSLLNILQQGTVTFFLIVFASYH